MPSNTNSVRAMTVTNTAKEISDPARLEQLAEGDQYAIQGIKGGVVVQVILTKDDITFLNEFGELASAFHPLYDDMRTLLKNLDAEQVHLVGEMLNGGTELVINDVLLIDETDYTGEQFAVVMEQLNQMAKDSIGGLLKTSFGVCVIANESNLLAYLANKSDLAGFTMKRLFGKAGSDNVLDTVTHRFINQAFVEVTARGETGLVEVAALKDGKLVPLGKVSVNEKDAENLAIGDVAMIDYITYEPLTGFNMGLVRYARDDLRESHCNYSQLRSKASEAVVFDNPFKSHEERYAGIVRAVGRNALAIKW